MFKLGDKVVPISKSVGCDPDPNWVECSKKGQPFLYFNGASHTDSQGRERYNVGRRNVPGMGNHYLLSDLIPFEASEDELFTLFVQEKLSAEQYERQKERG